ncbi:hypothetical protein BT96DRAFT_916681 [Gymnopus androsaceus JB14]|uniref:RRM domain-containing protein n=1 Tax=Gymnopus androsaceus JB14 TaxID=1447944 RepID=A0A6A4I631_9AGAR|nr:hypothetical protein BT96DRAFT_916681 [Gymnopus androsaceus JB14]
MFTRFLTRSVAQKTKFSHLEPLPKAATEDTLHQKLSEFGTVTKLHLPKFSHGGHKLHAQVVYENDESAEKLIKAANESTVLVHDIPIGCRPPLDPTSIAHRMARPPFSEITILNLPLSIEDTSELTSLLSQFGTINRAGIGRLYRGPAGYGFVEFAEVESAEKAFQAAVENRLSIGDDRLFIHYNKRRYEDENLLKRRVLMLNGAVAEQQVKEWLKPFAESIQKLDLDNGIVFSTHEAAFKAAHYLIAHPDFTDSENNKSVKMRVVRKSDVTTHEEASEVV